MLTWHAQTDPWIGIDYFMNLFRLLAHLLSFRVPVVALMDGITMGGGLGLSLPSRFRVVTERCGPVWRRPADDVAVCILLSPGS